MKILVIALGRLCRTGSAGNTVIRGLIENALRLDCEVTYVGLEDCLGSNSIELECETFTINKWSVKHFTLYYKSRQVNFVKRFHSGYNCANSKELLNKEMLPLNNIHYDGALAFETLGLELLRETHSRNKVAIVGDPAGERLWYSNNWLRPDRKLKALMLTYAEVNFYRNIDKIQYAIFGSKHARALESSLKNAVLDLRPFMPTPPELTLTINKGKRIIYFGGTLAGTASIKTMRILSRSIIPSLLSKYGRGGFELRVVGSPTSLSYKELGIFSEVNFIGHVESFESELSKGDIFLLPHQYPVGVRTRICSALAAGNICITHRTILQNMPELIGCESVLMAQSTSDYCKLIDGLPEGQQRFWMKNKSIEFFYENYHSSVSSAKIMRVLMGIEVL